MKKMYSLLVLFFISNIFVTPAGCAGSNEKVKLSNTKTSAKALVVIYSYTGNTGAVAQEIIKRFKADIIIIQAEEYDGITGSLKANIDSWNEVRTTDIKPGTVDMSQYNLIFLGSPIWWYRPAVPLWTFVEKNNFKDKQVVLFDTFNSKFKPEYMEKFIKLVEKTGSHFLDHIYVRRGRWYSQLNREELLEKFNRILDTKEEEYNKIIFRRDKK